MNLTTLRKPQEGMAAPTMALRVKLSVVSAIPDVQLQARSLRSSMARAGPRS